MSVGQTLLNVPFPEMVYKLASAIAESQFKLDMASIDILRIMGDKTNCPVHLPTVKVDSTGTLIDHENDATITTSMIGAGFQPTFYQFVETMIEVQMTVSITNEDTTERKVKGTEYEYGYNYGYRYPYYYPYYTCVRATPIDATYTNKYNFSQEGSSTIRTRLVPMPPNPFIQKLLEMKSQAMQQEFEIRMKEIELALENARIQAAEEENED